jgi:hypothetical protein
MNDFDVTMVYPEPWCSKSLSLDLNLSSEKCLLTVLNY